MADEMVSINNLRENTLEFDLKVEGVSMNEVEAKFVIRSADMDLAFPCQKDENGKWSVKLPPLPMLERTAYPYHFSITAEGFHFQPLKGSINVVGSNDVYVSGAKNTKLESPTKPEVKPEIKKEAVKPAQALPTKRREKGVAQLAQELMEANKQQAKPAPVVEVARPVVKAKEALLPTIKLDEKQEKPTASKDDAAIKVLEDMGIRTKTKAKPKKRFSLKD